MNSVQALSASLELAREAENQNEVPVGAVILTQEGEIIAIGKNTREQDHNPLGHAEIHALLSASQKLGQWRLLGCTLVVTLEPCPMCLAACQQARIEKVVFGAKDEKGGALSLGYNLHSDSRLNHQFTVEYLETKECSEILKNFFKKKRGKS